MIYIILCYIYTHTRMYHIYTYISRVAPWRSTSESKWAHKLPSICPPWISTSSGVYPRLCSKSKWKYIVTLISCPDSGFCKNISTLQHRLPWPQNEVTRGNAPGYGATVLSAITVQSIISWPTKLHIQSSWTQFQLWRVPGVCNWATQTPEFTLSPILNASVRP